MEIYDEAGWDIQKKYLLLPVKTIYLSSEILPERKSADRKQKLFIIYIILVLFSNSLHTTVRISDNSDGHWSLYTGGQYTEEVRFCCIIVRVLSWFFLCLLNVLFILEYVRVCMYPRATIILSDPVP